MGVPLVIIHFRLGFSLINHPAIGVPHGTPISGNLDDFDGDDPTLLFVASFCWGTRHERLEYDWIMATFERIETPHIS